MSEFRLGDKVTFAQELGRNRKKVPDRWTGRWSEKVWESHHYSGGYIGSGILAGKRTLKSGYATYDVDDGAGWEQMFTTEAAVVAVALRSAFVYVPWDALRKEAEGE